MPDIASKCEPGLAQGRDEAAGGEQCPCIACTSLACAAEDHTVQACGLGFRRVHLASMEAWIRAHFKPPWEKTPREADLLQKKNEATRTM